jgi:hypothetical protein
MMIRIKDDLRAHSVNKDGRRRFIPRETRAALVALAKIKITRKKRRLAGLGRPPDSQGRARSLRTSDAIKLLLPFGYVVGLIEPLRPGKGEIPLASNAMVPVPVHDVLICHQSQFISMG